MKSIILSLFLFSLACCFYPLDEPEIISQTLNFYVDVEEAAGNPRQLHVLICFDVDEKYELNDGSKSISLQFSILNNGTFHGYADLAILESWNGREWITIAKIFKKGSQFRNASYKFLFEDPSVVESLWQSRGENIFRDKNAPKNRIRVRIEGLRIK